MDVEEPGLLDRMVTLGRARAAYEASNLTESHEAINYIALLEAECKRVGIMFDEPS